MDEPRSVLRDLQILKFLPSDVRKLVEDSFVPVSYEFGGIIIREGEDADAFYVVASGRARVVKMGQHGKEVSLNVLRPCDTFGEMGLLERSKRTATVRASGDVECFKLDRSVFEALVGQNPEIRKYFELQIRHRTLENFLILYSPFARLPEEALRLLLTKLEVVFAEKGERVISQGEDAGPMYIVEEGRLRLFCEEDGRRHYLAYLRKGDFFGEMSLFKGIQRTASVEAVSRR